MSFGMVVEFSEEAQDELLQSVLYYESQQTSLGERFLTSIQDSVTHISEFPQMYREIETGIRRCKVLNFPYALIYREISDVIQIIAVMNLHRKPDYWKVRI